MACLLQSKEDAGIVKTAPFTKLLWRDERDVSVAADEPGTTSCPSGEISLVVKSNKASTTFFS